MPEQTKPFNWDDYVAVTPYRKVLAGMEGAGLIMPTMFSPDRKQVYLRSQDIAIGTKDVKRLRWALDAICRYQRLDIAAMDWSCEKAYLLQVDYIIVWSLLYNLDALPDDYKFPEHYLKKNWREIRPSVKDVSSILNEWKKQ